jgi:hypothetical protein
VATELLNILSNLIQSDGLMPARLNFLDPLIGVCKKTGKPNKPIKPKKINQKNRTEKKNRLNRLE